MSTPPRELLIVSPERWDEACFSVPAVRALAASGLGIGVLCRSYQKAFWETLPDLLVYTPSTLEEPWKAALLWEDGELAKVVRKAAIAKRIGPKIGKLAKQLTEVIADTAHPTEHRVQFYLKAVAEMGVATAKPDFFSPAQSMNTKGHNSILLSPDSDFGSSHEWPLERWLELCEKLVENFPDQPLSITYNAGALETVILEEFQAHLQAVEFNVDQPDLKQLARHPLVIAADGSIPHLAAHMGATCLTLFGPNDVHWKRPLGKRHQVVRRHVECAPCLSAKCALDLRCQHELEVDQVLEAALSLFNSASPQS